MRAHASGAAILSPPARRAIAMVIAFAVAAPPVEALAYLVIYAITKRAMLGIWDVLTLQDFIEYLPDIYTFGIGAALVAAIVVGWRQARRGCASPAFVVATGLLVGLVNAAILLAIAPDFGPPEVPVAVLMACHTLAFILMTIVCWRLGDLIGRAVGGAAP